jgi:succinate-semialdehyde dehydrogenase/glutarate-semialdehyde dehydrogenase
MPLDGIYGGLSLYINGEWRKGSGRTVESVLNPATGTALAELPHATTQDLDDALETSQAAFRKWRSVAPYDRSKILRRVADLIRGRLEEIARLITLEQGKPLHESRAELSNTADMFEWFAEEGRRAYGRIIPGRSVGGRGMVLKEPVGPAAAFAAWNAPAQTMSRKVGAALAAGCSIIYKPSEETPATPLFIARLFEEAGLPAGVLNVVFGKPAEVSAHLLASPIVRKVSFTGSVAVGRLLARLASDHLQRMTMELGGHAPVLVLPDADIESVAKGAVATKFRNAGQVCVSPTRFLVHESVHDRFVDAFVKIANDIRVGDGLDPSTRMGPLANPRRVEAMERFMTDARQRGITVACGGTRMGNAGFYYKPTVLVDAPLDSLAMNSEPFGPLAVTRRFSHLDDAISEANRLPYGLAAYAFTQSAKIINHLADNIECGQLAVNNFVVSTPETPFGGVKDSGYGSEGAIEGVDAFLSTKFVNLA